MSQIYSRLSDDTDQDSINSATHLCIFTHFLISIRFITSFLKTMWDEKYGCEKNYCFIYAIYIKSWLYLEYFITLDRYVGAPVSGKYVVGGSNFIYKCILKLEM